MPAEPNPYPQPDPMSIGGGALAQDEYGREFPFSPADLGEMMQDSYDRLESFRETRRRLIADYCGPHYGMSAPVAGVDPLFEADHHNLIQQTIDALLPNLTAKDIKPSVEARTQRLVLEAMARERQLERTLDDIGLADTHGQAVLDAFLGPFGIVWVGLRAADDLHVVRDRQFRKGQFVAACIDFDDYVIDQSAKRDTQSLFEGHRFRIRRAEALRCVRMDGSPMYVSEVVESAPTITTGDRDGGDVHKLAGHTGDPYRAADWLEFWSVAVYADGVVWIATVDRLGREAKFVREPYVYWGHGRGPYRKLSFLGVPNNAMPLAFANRVRDLHGSTKRVANKVIDDILTAKDVLIFRPGDEDLADAIRTASNGQQIKGDPTAVQNMTFGGSLANLFPALEFIRSMANDATGGSQLESGAKDNSKTATGASILQGRQQMRQEFMQAKSLRFLSSIVQAAAWYQVHDPFLQATVIQRLPGGHRVELRLDPEIVEGQYDEFAFTVKSLVNVQMDPSVKAARLIEIIGQLPALAALGPQAFTKIMSILSSHLDIPELDEINPDPSALIAKEQQMQAQASQTGTGGPAPQAQSQRPGAEQTGLAMGAMAPAIPPGPM